MSLPSDTTGIILVDDQNEISGFGTNRLIVVNDELGYEKSRFIIGHEFAHLVLHKEEGVQLAFRDYSHSTDQKEIEAEEYAKLILMPVELILRSIRDNKYCIYKKEAINYIAEICDVTKTKASDMISDMINDKFIVINEDSSINKEKIKDALDMIVE